MGYFGDWLKKTFNRNPPKVKRPARKPPRTWLNKRMIAAVKKYIQGYMNAVGLIYVATGIKMPWVMLAGVHYRETGFRIRRPKSGKPYVAWWCQIDCGGRGKERHKRRMAFLTRVEKRLKRKLDRSYGSFETGAILGAFRLAVEKRHRKWNSKYKKSQWPEEVMGDTFMAYNGRARYYNQFWQVGYGSKIRDWRFSPYPCNFLGGVRLNVKGSQDDSAGKKIEVPKRPDQNAGALLIVRELRRLKIA